jgi:hypothetical protein
VIEAYLRRRRVVLAFVPDALFVATVRASSYQGEKRSFTPGGRGLAPLGG